VQAEDSPRQGLGGLIDRPRLLDRLEASGPRRVNVLVAGAGFGKSSLARQWLRGRAHVWLTLTERDRSVDALARRWFSALPDAGSAADGPTDARIVAAEQGSTDDADRIEAVAELLARTIDDALVQAVVVDDLHTVADAASAQVIGALVRQLPARSPILITSRTGLPFPVERLRAGGDLAELSATELALDETEIGQVAESALATDASSLISPILALTAGWPAAVRLVVEATRSIDPAERAEWLATRGVQGVLFAYLAEEVIDREARDVVELIRVLAPHPRVDAGLCAALGLQDAPRLVAALERRGMFVVRGSADGTFALHDLIRAFAREHLPLPADRLGEGRRAAVRWHEDRGDPELALRTAADGAETELLRELLVRYAPRLLASGRVDAIIHAAETLGDASRSVEIDLAVVDALTHRGQGPEALARLDVLAAGSNATPAAIAWRRARLHRLHGDIARLSDAVEGVPVSGNARDDALLLAHDALGRFFGSSGDAVEPAVRGAALADTQADPFARSVAHMAAAYALRERDSQASAVHRRQALAAAEAAGDVVQIVRLRNADDDGPSLAEQFDMATGSLALIEAAGNPAWLANTLLNRGILAIDLGRLEAAEADLERARAVGAAVGASAEIMSVAFLAELARIRGGLAQAEIRFRQAIEAADADGDADTVSFARAGLARVLAMVDPEASRREIARSLETSVDLHRHDYLLADAWIAACHGRSDHARQRATEILGRVGTSPGREVTLASALEVDGIVSPEPAHRAHRLNEALAIYERIGNEPAASVTRLALATFSDGPGSRSARRARAQMEASGIRASAADAAGLLAMIPIATPPPLAIRVLGGFAVVRDGHAVAIGEWKSKKARDLLKILVLRHGAPIAREELAELLWPEDPADAGNRLSVALSLLRSVLDPGKARPADRYVTTEREAVALRNAEMSVDLDDFLADARAGLTALTRADRDEAERLLVAAEARFAGDLLPEDAFAEWSIHARESARSLYLEVLGGLADIASARGDQASAGRYLMRAIGIDPFDEPSHLRLVSAFDGARRYGEARRAYQTYVRRMAELEIEPAPYPMPPAAEAS
jgi:ATP/maltotriose-dependent transcriptional regulator MalT/DNA-binding SARP family transcriptional activator